MIRTVLVSLSISLLSHEFVPQALLVLPRCSWLYSSAIQITGEALGLQIHTVCPECRWGMSLEVLDVFIIWKVSVSPRSNLVECPRANMGHILHVYLHQFFMCSYNFCEHFTFTWRRGTQRLQIGGVLCFTLGLYWSDFYTRINCENGVNIWIPLNNLVSWDPQMSSNTWVILQVATWTGFFAIKALHIRWSAFVHLVFTATMTPLMLVAALFATTQVPVCVGRSNLHMNQLDLSFSNGSFYSWYEEQKMSRGNKDYGDWNAAGNIMIAICSYIIGELKPVRTTSIHFFSWVVLLWAYCLLHVLVACGANFENTIGLN